MGEDFFISLTDATSKVGSSLGDWLSEHILNIAVILIGAWFLRHFGARMISEVLRHTIRADLYPLKEDREKRLKTLSSLVSAAIGVGVYIVAAMMIISELGINTGPLIASAGVVGIALGFGAQSLIKDFMSGIFIITENQYRVGDIVQLGTVSGKVEAISIRTTVLRDLDGHVHHVPNGTIMVTTNKTMGHSNINETITVAADTNLEQLEHVVNHAGEELAAMPEYKHKVQTAPHYSRVSGLSGKGVSIKIQGQVTPGMQWAIRSELLKRLAKAFEKHKIKIVS